MDAKRSWSEFLRTRTVSLAALSAVLLAAIEIAVDVFTRIHLNVSIVYALPLVLAAATRRPALVWSLLAALMLTTFVIYSQQIPPGMFALHEPLFLNRVLSAVTLLLTAGMLHAWIAAVNALDAHRHILEERNAQLEAVNRELVVRDERIERQNEELDSRRVAAEAASSRKMQILASVSHDIRTPLQAIGMLAEVIGRTAEDPHLVPQIPGLAQRLQSNARSLAELLADVIDMIRLESGGIPLHKSSFDVAALLEEQSRSLLPLAKAKGIALRSSADAGIWLSTDRPKLARVLANLVGNAIKFTRQGEVVIQASLTSEGSIVICVRDTGIGIAPEQIERIFEEFARVEGEQPVLQGWGLGLAICRRLVSALGGTISVESEPGAGSAFSVRLPAACVERRGGGEPPPGAGSSGLASPSRA